MRFVLSEVREKLFLRNINGTGRLLRALFGCLLMLAGWLLCRAGHKWGGPHFDFWRRLRLVRGGAWLVHDARLRHQNEVVAGKAQRTVTVIVTKI